MRLDHLLSREPIFGDACGLGFFRVVCVSCACICTLPVWVVGVGAFFGLGINVMQEASMLSGSRSTPVGRIAHDCWHQGLFGVGGCVVCCL